MFAIQSKYFEGRICLVFLKSIFFSVHHFDKIFNSKLNIKQVAYVDLKTTFFQQLQRNAQIKHQKYRNVCTVPEIVKTNNNTLVNKVERVFLCFKSKKSTTMVLHYICYNIHTGSSIFSRRCRPRFFIEVIPINNKCNRKELHKLSIVINTECYLTDTNMKMILISICLLFISTPCLLRSSDICK